ncbi:hypothetical protein HZA33_02015 [Candidatus Pacearchaeota archaeon]|nr:hypothetical protein [Candidatus Pacearchaeota archaeon]
MAEEEEVQVNLGEGKIFGSAEDYVNEIVNVNKLAAEIFMQVFHGLPQYCIIPKKFEYCRLAISPLNLEEKDDEQKRKIVDIPTGLIYNAKPPQQEAVEFFNFLLSGNSEVCENNDPLRPRIGAYLVGPPGVGKTHIMTAYAIEMKKKLEQKLGDVYNFLREGITEECKKQILTDGFSKEYDPDRPKSTLDMDKGVVEEDFVGDEAINKSVGRLRDKIKKYQYKPTDIVFVSFDQLYELCISAERRETLDALINAPVVFVDDIHPKGNEDRATIIGHIIERRYESGKQATFLTSNLSDKDLGEMFKQDESIGKRLHSRFSEMFYLINFEDCEDWRITIGKLKIDAVKNIITQRLRSKEIKQE